MCYPTFKMGNVKCRTLYKYKTLNVASDWEISRLADGYQAVRRLLDTHFPIREPG